MTVLENTIRIDATPEAVWRVLGTLDVLHEYDPGVKKAALLSGPSEGLGASRKCDLAPGGWFEERVTEWKPHAALAFELSACTLPVKRLKHRYTLTPSSGGTVVTQRMEYELKFGPLGRAMDALMVRRKWNDGVLSFFAGLKARVEGSNGPGTAETAP
jgi:ligand-binding SRPBCC domain-containing protein